jgi:L-ascorbate metabolism protein UlaG (beta-lactamase superfamily)
VYGGKRVTKNIQWLGHDTFKISDGSTVIYTDPFKLAEGGDKADIILITHEHYDHCIPEEVAKIQKDDTVIVAPASCADKLKGNVKVVKPGDKIEVKGVPIEVIWAYNVNKFRSPGQPFHPKSPDFVGYIFTADGQRIYLSGDTDLIPEMSKIDVDIAMIPVSGTYVMTAEEAIQAANTAIKAKTFIPMHYNAIVGTDDDAKRFAAGVKNAKVEVLPQS